MILFNCPYLDTGLCRWQSKWVGHCSRPQYLQTLKKRLDFSCAIFDSNGDLIANAPHIPIHLGSMSYAVKAQIELWKGKLQHGDVLVSNHPKAGGSHLPDITVITPVLDESNNPLF